MKSTFIIAALCACTFIYAQETKVSRPDAHAPIGVMGDHLHKKGEFMVSYRFMTMPMEDNLIGNTKVSADEVVTTVDNRFFAVPGQPPTLRVVPENMTMNMHMIGAMYGLSDNLTLMAMTMYATNKMDHITYQGGMGTTVLGEFTTESSGFGDTRLTAMYRVADHTHVNLGISIPTGSIEEEGQVLAPNGMQPRLRLPYPMQLGSGTWDLMPALTYAKRYERMGVGGQAYGVFRMGKNDNGFSYGDKIGGTVWGSYLVTDWLSGSLRLDYMNINSIDGIDPDIVAPVQTANPDFQGGTRVDALIGVNLIGQSGFVKNQRIGVEFGIPISQDLNGPQLQTNSVLTLGYQYAF